MKRLLASALAATMVLAVAPGAAARARNGSRALSVVSFIDTGINPYHKVFRDTSAQAYKHPSTYIPGYPKDAVALRLSLDEKDYDTAVVKDCKRVWSKVKTGKLYWFPGTKIVGAITVAPPTDINCTAPSPVAEGRILDPDGHGTMVASRGASTEYGACKTCKIVSIQMPVTIPFDDPGSSTDYSVEAITWAANNSSWIDAQSNSWGPVAPVWEPTGEAGLIASNPKLVRAVEEVSSQHLAFWASGNGLAFRFGVLGHPTLLASHFGPSAIIVGGHDSGYVTTWPGFPPHLVSDACDAWAAERAHTTESGERVGGGTSGATPFVAGGAGQILTEARALLGDDETGVEKGVVASGPAGRIKKGPLADGKFTIEEMREVLFKTASPRPKGQHEDGPPCMPGPYMPTPIKWTDVPPQYPEFLHIGYGAVDKEAVAQAKKVLTGSADIPDRATTDQYFALDHEVRSTTHTVFRGPGS